MESDKNNLNDELKKLSPLLNKLQRKEKLPEVPNGYFEGLSDTMWKQLQKEQPKPAFSIWKNNSVYSLLAAACIIAIVSLIGLRYFSSQNSNTDWDKAFASLSDEEVNSYIVNNIENFDHYELIDKNEISNYPENAIEAMELEDEDLENYINQL